LVALAATCAVGLLFTFSRSSLLVLAGGLVVLAAVRRRVWPRGAAAATVAAGVAFAAAFPSIAPRGDWTAADLAQQRARAAEEGGVEGGPLSPAEPSIESHLESLREGLRTGAEHPQGYGLGNAGAVAVRTDVPLRAGESNYTELGVEIGVLGLLAFVAWNVALLAGLARAARRDRDAVRRWAAAAAAASLAAVLALAIQTDTLGVPWLAYCVWWLGGSLVRPGVAAERATAARPVAATRSL
jgi:O-antigen ligase